MKKSVTKDQKGFTIVEVLIVLAIAGLIILIVLLAVPALQRNSRNTQRGNDVSQVSGAISERVNNNNGQLDQGTAPNAVIAEAAGRMSQLGVLDYDIVAPGNPGTFLATVNPDTLMIRNNFKCNSTGATPYQDPGSTTNIAVSVGDANTNIITTTGATFRSIVAVYATETSNGLLGQCQEL